MNFDVFISYPHQDKAVADAACAKLEEDGIRCWIAPRDVPPGAEWAGAIVDAIDHCRAMVLIFSSSTNESKQIRREVQQAFDGEKPVVPFRIENVVPEKSLRYYMGSVHWLDALTSPLEQHLQKLVASVGSLVGTTILEREPAIPGQVPESSRPITFRREKSDQRQREQPRQAEVTNRIRESQTLRSEEAKRSAEDERSRLQTKPRAGQAVIFIVSLLCLVGFGTIVVLEFSSHEKGISPSPPAALEPLTQPVHPVPVPAPTPTPTKTPATMQSDDIVGQWGYGAYHSESDRARTEADARGKCGQPGLEPIQISGGTNGGVMMYLADTDQQTELFLKRSSSGRTYLGPPGSAGGLQDRQVLFFDGNIMILRWLNREVQGRYGMGVYVRCTQ